MCVFFNNMSPQRKKMWTSILLYRLIYKYFSWFKDQRKCYWNGINPVSLTCARVSPHHQVQSVLCCVHSQPGLPHSSPHCHYNSHAARSQVQRGHYGIKHIYHPEACGLITKCIITKHSPYCPPFSHTLRRTRPLSCWTTMTTTMTTPTTSNFWRMSLRRISTTLRG